jgi:hypothetical protein
MRSAAPRLARRFRSAAAVIVALLAMAPSAWLEAQGPAVPRLEQPTAPGWVFTPGIAASESWDNNVLLATEDSGVAGDYLTSISPRGALGYRGRYTTFRVDYEGAFHLYQQLTELNAFEQRAGMDLRRRLSPRFTFFARDSLTRSPTTDAIDLPGIRFRRQGVVLDDVRAGVESRFTERTTLTTAYTFQWLQFADNPAITTDDVFHQGGHSHGASASLQHALQQRISIGADFDMRNATLATRDPIDGTREFDVQNALGTIDVKLNERYALSGGAGLSWLSTSELGGRRTAPALRVSLTRSGEHFAWGVAYRRSFLPSFGFGGTFQNEELTGNVLAPLSRRLDVSGGLAWRNNDALVGDFPPLRSIWARSSISYLATKWLRVEGYYSQAFQDSQRAGGKVDRIRYGVQVVTSTRVRIR